MLCRVLDMSAAVCNAREFGNLAWAAMDDEAMR